MTAVSPPAPQTIPVPADFPVRLDGDDQALIWERDRMRFPGQVTPLEAELVSGAIARGLTHAARLYDLPLHGFKSRAFNGYVYSAAIPVIAEHDELEELHASSAARLMPAVAEIGQRWDDELLPEIRALIAANEAIDHGTATVGELIAHLRESRQRLERMWQIHFQVITPAYLAVSEFEEMVQDLFCDDERFAARMLHARERVAAIGEARARLAGHPTPVVGQFEAMLAAAQEGVRLTEDHGFHIESHGVDSVRQIVMTLGRRLAATRMLAAPEDILMFEIDELELAGCRYPCADLRPVVAARRARLARYADATPPPVLGTVPPGPLPENPMLRVQFKFWGTPPAPPPPRR